MKLKLNDLKSIHDHHEGVQRRDHELRDTKEQCRRLANNEQLLADLQRALLPLVQVEEVEEITIHDVETLQRLAGGWRTWCGQKLDYEMAFQDFMAGQLSHAELMQVLGQD